MPAKQANEPQQLSFFVVFHVEVVSKRGREHSDADARDLLAANRARIAEAGGTAQLSRSFGIMSDNGPVSPVITLDLPRETDPKKTQTNPSAFFPSETDRVTVTWREVTPETQPALPDGVSDLGKAVGSPTTVAGDTAEPNITEVMKHAAG